ncbi:MAG: hypothetical protein K0S47_4476 [Herbinix sp.]|jgi:hypothetical protein|nr:hypothetical protein [Herbinix sp.]
MNKFPIESQEVKIFLEDVTNQIRYKPIHNEIEEELKGHMEDRVYEFIELGMDKDDAIKKAVEQMGDPNSIGIMINETRYIKNSWPLLCMVFASVFLGVISNFIDNRLSWGQGFLNNLSDIIFNTNYFIWGLFVLGFLYYSGYTLLIKHTKFILWGFGVSCFAQIVVRIINFHSFHIFYSYHVIGYYSILLFGLILAVLVYRMRQKGIKAVLCSAILLMAMILLQSAMIKWNSYISSAVVILLMTWLISLLFMIVKGYIVGKKRSLIALSILLMLLMIGLYNGLFYSAQRNNLELFLTPEKQAVDHWEDGYNGVLIKELLGKASLFGPIQLSKEELMNYGTGAWYFDEEEVANITTYLHYNIDTVTLEKILPQHYHNNYRLACWVLDYGWLPAFLFIAFIAVFYGILFAVASRIKNKLGNTIAICSSSCLSLQMILYLLGNFGYQYGSFSTLPFISEGLLSITINMVLVGMVLSAYRYDKVIREEKLIVSRFMCK